MGASQAKGVDRWWDLPILVVNIEKLGEQRFRGQRYEDRVRGVKVFMRLPRERGREGGRTLGGPYFGTQVAQNCSLAKS